ncbi:hypothetical protein ABG79_00904 [Caloramator mitchellensis]|uniref:DUF2281 domain-containing protein n=1 Tax=Caloramator mitchellensis TaxID=908809 RepID=A0A0R3K2G0_CALMK|nr:DUF2281 domain-containing protein [Caloramator mitchellensis]KRQ87106.1 hypothetical protein ABG79_00904 [Caloramator mitchellensis]
MNLAEKIFDDIRTLPEKAQAEVIEYIEFLKYREKKQREKLMDQFIDENFEALKELAK